MTIPAGVEPVLRFRVDEPGEYEISLTRVADAPPPKPRPVLGVQVHALWTDPYWPSGQPGGAPHLFRHMELLKSHGVDLIRVDYGWSAGQPENKPLSLTPGQPGAWWNERLAIVLDIARDMGLKVLVTVQQSPLWARPGTGSNVKQYPTGLAAWEAFIEQFADMFGGHAAFFAMEVWNEPNLQSFTAIADPGQRAARYAEILSTAVNATTTRMMFGGPSQCDDAFVKATLERSGGGRDVDIMSVHPYQADQTVAPDDPYNPGSVGSVLHFPAVRDAAASVLEPAPWSTWWWSEFGYSVHPNTGSEPKWKKGVASEAIAADYLVRQLNMAREWGVAGCVVYVAYRPTGDVHEQGYSLIRPDGTPRAQLAALKAWTEADGG